LKDFSVIEVLQLALKKRTNISGRYPSSKNAPEHKLDETPKSCWLHKKNQTKIWISDILLTNTNKMTKIYAFLSVLYVILLIFFVNSLLKQLWLVKSYIFLLSIKFSIDISYNHTNFEAQIKTCTSIDWSHDLFYF
jgi:hypothetical protein